MTADEAGAPATRIVLRPLATALPLGRHGRGRTAVGGDGPLGPRQLVEEAGIRPQL